MTIISTKVGRTMLGTLAAGALAGVSVTPAMADDRRDRGGIGAGEIIAGAVVVGGIAALAGAFDGDRGRRGWNEADWRGGGWQGRGAGRGQNGLVERCVRAAEIDARRRGGWQFAHVTQIRDVDRTRNGFRVRGVIEVEGARGFRGRDFDRGRFNCFADGRGRPIIEFGGLRGFR
jgi:hypothetical protein